MRKQLCAAAMAAIFVIVGAKAAFAQTDRASVPGSEVNGTFRMSFSGKFKSFSNEVKILALGGGKLRVAMSLVYPYSVQKGEPMVNLGELDGKASIKGDIANYASDDGKCSITIKFVRLGTIKVTQDGSDSDCGFGHNVVATGTYKKVSGKKPSFERQH